MDHLERQLAEEELNSGEIRQLLDRLAQEELGGSEMSTLRDVAEATGTTVNVLARMLAEIRQVPEVRQTLEVHEERLDDHERRIRSANSPNYDDFKNFRKQEIEEENAKSWVGGVIGLAVALCLFCAVLPLISAKPEPLRGAVSRSVQGDKGETYTVRQSREGIITYTATLPDGTTRPMTEKERSDHPELTTVGFP